ncbi:MAG: TauD/TfdA family dioxygenase [Alphaproteobacteria bacterium]|nr:TauD/TfdA family dioxygenase [Alphaproteobacteria bacterium]
MADTGLRFRIQPTGGALGADVFGFPFKDFTAAEFAAVRAAWTRHQVLRFRGIDITDEDQIRFAAGLGPFVIHPRQMQEGTHGSHREILVISNLKKADGSPAGDLGDGEVNWHTDTWFVTRPPSASILRALRLPAHGGNTCFLDMYAAYDTLDDAAKKAIEGRYIHHQKVIDGRGDVRMGMVRPRTDDVRSWPGVPHPIVRTVPESGRKALYLGGRRHAWIIGMEPDESAALLAKLWTHCIQDRFVWCQQWQPGDMVMWDNRCVMHRRDAFDPNTIRLMHRTAIEGERPV